MLFHMEQQRDPVQESRAIAENVKRLLDEAELSLRSASSETEIPLATLSRKINGRTPFTAPELAAIAQLLGTSVSILVDTSDKNGTSSDLDAA